MKQIMKPYIFALITFFSVAHFAHASAQESDKSQENNDAYRQLGKQDYDDLLPGKTIKGEYRFMRARTKTFRFEEHHNANGTTDYTEGPIRSKGIWFTLGEHKVCYKYPDDNTLSGTSCFWVYKADKCYYGYGLNSMTLRGPRDFNDWSARWIIKGDGGSCDTPVS